MKILLWLAYVGLIICALYFALGQGEYSRATFDLVLAIYLKGLYKDELED